MASDEDVLTAGSTVRDDGVNDPEAANGLSELLHLLLRVFAWIVGGGIERGDCHVLYRQVSFCCHS